jgi:FHS family glucose/mannose:H+ symporter-like MFS transporter
MPSATRLLPILCGLIMLLFGMMLTVVGPLLIAISDRFALSLAQSGLVFSVNFFGFVVFLVFGGALADRIGKKTVLGAALAGLAASLALTAFAPSAAVLFVGMFLLGGFGGVLEVLTSAFIAEVSPDPSGRTLNRLQIFFGAGAVIGPVGAAALVSAGVDWSVCYLAMAGAAAVLTAAFALAARGAARRPARAAGASAEDAPAARQRPPLADGRFLLVCLAMFLYTGAEVGSWGWLSTYLKSTQRFGLLEAGAATSVFWLAMTVGRGVCGRLAGRYSLGALIPILAGLSAAAAVATGLAAGPAAAWALAVGFGLALSSQWPFIVAYGANYRASSSGADFALLVGSGGLGGMVLPGLMGLVAEAGGQRASMAVLALALAALALIFVGFALRPAAQARVQAVE